MNARVRVGRVESVVDLGRPVSLALELTFTERDPRYFGAPAARSHPLAAHRVFFGLPPGREAP